MGERISLGNGISGYRYGVLVYLWGLTLHFAAREMIVRCFNLVSWVAVRAGSEAAFSNVCVVCVCEFACERDRRRYHKLTDSYSSIHTMYIYKATGNHTPNASG